MSDVDGFLAGLTPGRGADVLAVEVDLRWELTLATGGSTTARLTGHGQRMRVDAQRPEVLVAAVDRADVGRAAELLAATGIRVDVHGPHGPVATLGAGTTNRVGRALTGSPRVSVAPRAAARLAWADRSVRTAAAVVSAVLVVLAAARARH